MESKLSPDKEKEGTPQEPINEYQWDDLRRDRKSGRYPWTHLLKPPLEGEITAEDIIRETTPRRSMSREFSRSRTHSPVDGGGQKILNLDSSPGSSRKHGDEGEDEGVHIPNFSKEVSLDCEDDAANHHAFVCKQPESQTNIHLEAPVSTSKNVSPKGILKRRVPDTYIGVTETREKTKCCHPLVNKIKHLADKTLNKLEKNEGEKSPLPKRKKQKEGQEIRQLKSSPGAVRRKKFSAIKLGDSDEMSKTMSIDTPPPRKKKEHIYEDIEESESQEREKSLHFAPGMETERESNSNKETESFSERKSLASQDPSLVIEDEASLKSDEHIMEKLHKARESNKEAIILDEEMDPDEPNVEEIFQNQLEETRPKNDSPNITITEIFDDDIVESSPEKAPVSFETSPTPSPQAKPLNKKNGVEIVEKEWSKPPSDHEYEIIEKPPPNIDYNLANVETKPSLVKTDDELSSTTSLERKYLQHPSDEEELQDDKENEGILNAELLQKDIEDRYFVNTPSTMSRTECEISTSQVDSSALENLPLKRDSRQNAEGLDAKIQQRIKEGAGKLKSQAGKLRTKLKSMKMPDKPKITLPERPKFKMPERPKFVPEKSKFTLPDKRKFSLPDRPKFKKINLSEKLSFGDRTKFTLPERPKFNVPDFSKFKIPDKSKINFPSLGRRKVNKKDDSDASGSTPDVRNITPAEFEAKTYPRLFGRKKKSELPKTSSSPNLDREETPPATFTFTRMKKQPTQKASYIQDSPNEPREYGNTDSFDAEAEEREQFETTYDFDKLDPQYMQDEGGVIHLNGNNDEELLTQQHSPVKEEHSHIINEINNDEFFVRPRGISRENIQVREYLSDEIRQAFKIPRNALALMGSHSGVNDENIYANEPEADPELMLDDNERYSTEDLNDRDDGYYTFPPVRPSRAKRKKKQEEIDTAQYLDDNMTTDMHFSEIDLGLAEDQGQLHSNDNLQTDVANEIETQLNFSPNELRSIHEYANDDVIQYPEDIPVQSQTLPMPPQRKKKFGKRDFRHSSLNDFKDIAASELWEEAPVQNDDIIVYRTEHEYIVPRTEATATERSPLPPRRNRSRSSRGTSLCDDDRTSHGAESLTMDTHVPALDYIESDKYSRHESPGYATVDKSACAPNKGIRRSQSKTPPVRRRKSNSSERKYYTVQPVSKSLPDRPPRKKSSTSLMTLDSFSKRSVSGDLTQYVEIDEPQIDDIHKELISGEVVNKMKDRPLPPPPRPPRGPKRRKSNKNSFEDQIEKDDTILADMPLTQTNEGTKVDEIEVSTQTDPLPDDIDYELGIEENLDFSMSSSLRDIVNEEPYRSKSHSKIGESPRVSRPTSRSEKSFKLSDPKISELSKSNVGRTSPTVILVERRVSSPTRINERDEMLTEASLTVQHIDIDEARIPDVPPLPRPKSGTNVSPSPRKIVNLSDGQALERVTETSRDVQLDNLVTQRLQVRDLDVGRLNVSELQASKILVSDIEGMTLQVTELDSKSGHISVSGIEFSQSVIDEIVKKFAEISTNVTATQAQHELPRPMSREGQTQTDQPTGESMPTECKSTLELDPNQPSTGQISPPPPPPPPKPSNEEEASSPPQRPPPPDLTPLLYSYLQDITMPPASYYHRPPARDRPFTENHDSQHQHQSPPLPTRRAKRRPAAPHSESSSDDALSRPSPRRMPPPVRPHEPTITEAGANFLRVCHNSISRTIRNIFNSFVSYISGTEDKKDVQMALVIFLVLIAGLIMFGLSDSRTIHHHHWEFFNPPDGKQ